MRLKSMDWVGGCLAAALMLGSVTSAPGQAEQQGPPPATVRLGVAKVETVQNQWDVVGRLQQVRQSVVASEVAGKIVELAVDQGDVVERGRTVLARVDDVWAKIAVSTAEAALAGAQADHLEAQARLAKSRSDMDKLEELLRTGVAKQREYDEARAVYEADEARVTAAAARIRTAEAALNRAQREMERLIIHAPFDGVVVRKMIEVGEWADVGAAIVEIVSHGSIDAVIDVPERLINNVEVGAAMEVYIEAIGQSVEGKIVAIVPQGMNASRTFPVKIRLSDQQGKLMSGMSVVARVPTTQQIQAVTVPRDAVLQTPRGPVVWAAVEGKAVSIPVQVLFGHGGRYVVESTSGVALTNDMPVVVEGGERIMMPGQPLMEVKSAATAQQN